MIFKFFKATLKGSEIKYNNNKKDMIKIFRIDFLVYLTINLEYILKSKILCRLIIFDV